MRSDVCGLGGVLYFLLMGAPPFEGTPKRELMAAHVEKQLVPAGVRLGTPIDHRLEAILARCLAASSMDRYADAGELLTALCERNGN